MQNESLINIEMRKKAGHHGVGREDFEKIVKDCLEMGSALLYNTTLAEAPTVTGCCIVCILCRNSMAMRRSLF